MIKLFDPKYYGGQIETVEKLSHHRSSESWNPESKRGLDSSLRWNDEIRVEMPPVLHFFNRLKLWRRHLESGFSSRSHRGLSENAKRRRRRVIPA